MREKWPKQMPLMSHILDHPQSKELETISGIIDENATICRHVLQDLNRGKVVSHRAGARGMSADQVLRCANMQCKGDGPAGRHRPLCQTDRKRHQPDPTPGDSW